MKIVICDVLDLGDELLTMVQQTVPSATVVLSTPERLAEELADAEIFFGFTASDVFSSAAKLKWIQTTSAGLDKVLRPELIERDLIVTNASGVHAPQVAELAWALTLAVSRALPTYFRQQQAHHWQYGPIFDLSGGTAGIIGLGGIGRQYAKVALAMGMRVVAVDPHEPPNTDGVEAVWKLDRLDELLRTADVVLVSCPYTPETRYLIDGPRLAQMQPTAILVNIARGGIVDEEALAEALRAGRLRGAALDVCETEPLPADSPLWDVPNLLITPHCAGLSPHRNRRLAEFFCQNLRRYLAEEPLLNVVDQQRGYPVAE